MTSAIWAGVPLQQQSAEALLCNVDRPNPPPPRAPFEPRRDCEANFY